MADSFFGFDTLLSNLNDDEGPGEPSEDEYDALNDETFGQDSDAFDWEVEHERLAGNLESSRRRHSEFEHNADQLEASLSQLVLDETDTPLRTLGSSVWRHDAPFPPTRTPVPTLKNVCTVEELERQIRQKQQQQQQQQHQQQQQAFSSNFFSPRFPVILQRPPGLQAPVPLPFAPQQPMTHNMNQLNQPMSQMNQSLSNILGQNNQTNVLHNQLGQNVNQIGQNMNQMGQNMNQMNQMGQNMNQMGQNVNPFMQNANQMNQFQNNQIGQNNMMNFPQNLMNQPNQMMANQMQQNVNQMAQNVNQLVQNVNQMGQNQMSQNSNQMGQNMNPIGQNMNQMGQNMNQMGQNLNQNMNQMLPNGNQFSTGMNQFPQMMGQPRMIAPPPGMGMPRQNFNQNVGQFNPNFRPPAVQSKLVDQQQQMNHSNINMTVNQSMQSQNINQQMKNQSTQINPKQNSQANQTQTTINQSLNQTMNQSLNQSMNQSMNQSLNQSLNQSMNQSLNQSMNQSNQSNQTSQSPQSKAQKPLQNSTPRSDQKVQKSRIYNNSKNMTSQNLVQLIQNTHPMLQFNNSFHNASHHPMLNRNNAFNNQFVNNHVFNNQRHNGTYSNSSLQMNGDDSSCGSDTDEYAGLMTQREKQWLINIQMLQLNTGTPYIHDFYYTVFLERQASKEKEGIKEAHKANQQNHPFYSGAVKQESHSHGRERHNSARHNSTSEDATTPRTYVPAQFENSLGKLQCGSVTAPRKIIDVEVVGSETGVTRNSRPPSVASTTHPSEVPREVRRTKQLLLDIEALYLILLRLEELNDPLAISNALILKEREEKQKQLEQAQKEAELEEEDSNVFLRNIESVQRRPKQESPKTDPIDKRQVVNLAVNQKPAPVKNLLDEDKDDLMNKMFIGLLHGDRLAQMLTVRKGRTLVCRFVSRVPPSHARLRSVWSRVMRGLSAAARRDDGTLASLAPHFARYIHASSGWTAVLESCGFLSEALDPARTPHALTTSFTLTCVCALLEKASTLVTTRDATSSERQWYKFLKTLARALKNTSLNVAKPLKPLPETRLICHLKQLDSRSTVEILQRGKAAEFADLSKTDVSEQLLKHLC